MGRDVGLGGGTHGATVVHQLFGVVDDRACLLGQFRHPGQAAAGHRLIARDHHAYQLGFVMQHLEHRHRGHGGAVRVGDDALFERPGPAYISLEVDLRHHQRHVHVFGARPTSCRSPSLRRPRTAAPAPATSSCPRRTTRCPGRSGPPLRRLRPRSPGRGRSAYGPANGRGEEPHLPISGSRRKITLLEQRAHHLADLTGGANYANRNHLPPRPRIHRRLLLAAEPERLVQRNDGLV